MRQPLVLFAVTVFAAGLLNRPVCAQLPTAPRNGQRDERRTGDDGVSNFVSRMMAFDKNKDGQLTRDEITDPRLLRLFDRADTNKDGIVTKEELIALAKQLQKEEGGAGGLGSRIGFRPGPPGGFGPGPGFGPGGRGGPRGPNAMPRPGQILPAFLQNVLRLTDEQKKQVADLQKEVDSKLEKILTPAQKKELQGLPARSPRPLGPPVPTGGFDGPPRDRPARP